MNLQQSILNQYLELKGKPTLKVISQDTGLQMTRIFRLLNGSTMKVNEYQIFQQKVMELRGDNLSIVELAIKCSSHLSEKTLLSIGEVMERYLDLHQLLSGKALPQQTSTGSLA